MATATHSSPGKTTNKSETGALLGGVAGVLVLGSALLPWGSLGDFDARGGTQVIWAGMLMVFAFGSYFVATGPIVSYARVAAIATSVAALALAGYGMIEVNASLDLATSSGSAEVGVGGWVAVGGGLFGLAAAGFDALKF